eukprot:1180655-Prymnesium_polylepis.2
MAFGTRGTDPRPDTPLPAGQARGNEVGRPKTLRSRQFSSAASALSLAYSPTAGRRHPVPFLHHFWHHALQSEDVSVLHTCLLYTSDAADDM